MNEHQLNHLLHEQREFWQRHFHEIAGIRRDIMSVSTEVQAVLDKARESNDLVKSVDLGMKGLQQQVADLQAKIDALPTGTQVSLSDEDKAALVEAAGDLDTSITTLRSDIPANVSAGPVAPAPVTGVIPPVDTDGHPTDAPTSGDVLAVNGPANNPAGGSAPLMPTMAFNPDPTGMRGVGDGQPNQPAAIETPGGFVVSGGGTTVRAPGSMPDSPSSTLVVPTDPDAKAPANNADLIKSGLGDSSQNALIDADGKPVADIAAGQAAAAPKTDLDAIDAPANLRPVIEPTVAETDAERTAKEDAADPEGSKVSDADKPDAVPPAAGGPNSPS